MNAITATEAAALIAECGEEMRRASTLPLWSQHETSARIAGNEPKHHRIGSKEHDTWVMHQRGLAKVGPHLPAAVHADVVTVNVGRGYIPAGLVYADHKAGFSLE
jgi:hypothetical protein